MSQNIEAKTLVELGIVGSKGEVIPEADGKRVVLTEMGRESLGRFFATKFTDKVVFVRNNQNSESDAVRRLQKSTNIPKLLKNSIWLDVEGKTDGYNVPFQLPFFAMAVQNKINELVEAQ